MKHLLIFTLALFIFAAPAVQAGDAAASKQPQSKLSAEEIKHLGLIVSNFTEQSMYDVDAAKMTKDDLIPFGIWHLYLNDFKKSIKPCPVKDCPYGSLYVDKDLVSETIKRYLDFDFKEHASTERGGLKFHFDGKGYHFNGADGEATYYAGVKAVRKLDDGTLELKGDLYNVEDKNDIIGSFTAIVKPKKYKGKDTYSLISLKSEMK